MNAAATTTFTGSCFACGGVGHSKKRCPQAVGVRMGARGPVTVVCYDCKTQVPDLRQHRLVCASSRLAKSRVVVATTAPGAALLAGTTDYYAVLDVSASMANGRLAAAKAALLEDIVPRMADADRFALITFDTGAFFKLQPRAVRQLRAQRELAPLLARVFARGNTALWDALHLAVSQVRNPARRTHMTVLTDGEDNSSKHTHAEVLALLAAHPNVTLNIVHVGDAANAQYAQTAAVGRGTYRVVSEGAIRAELKLSFANGASAAVTVSL